MNPYTEIPSAIGSGLLAFILLWYARKKNYFSLSGILIKWDIQIRWFHVVGVFLIYFMVIGFCLPWLALFFKSTLASSPPIAAASWINFSTSLFMLAIVVVYASMLPCHVARHIWRRSGPSSYIDDIRCALISFFLSFPVVIFLNETLDLMLYYGFHIQALPEQLAVRFLKMTFHQPLYFGLSVFTIVILAPLLEEILFRGFLQSFIRQYLGTNKAILITAVCFSFFHYSPQQGFSNISIIGSLFALALFLGFVYEKQGSLAASITLHAAFNATNVINLYFFGGFPSV